MKFVELTSRVLKVFVGSILIYVCTSQQIGSEDRLWSDR